MPPPLGGPKRVRCKWFNDLGYPRINPEKIKRNFPDPRGCRFPSQKCYYAHPDHPDWATASLSPYIQPSEYPDGRVPTTPDPDKWPPSSTMANATPQGPRLGKRKSRSRSRSRSRGRSPAGRMSGNMSRMRTPERRVNVKAEPRSPVLRAEPGSFNQSRSVSKDRIKERYGMSASGPLVNRVGPRRSISPYGRRVSGSGNGPRVGPPPRSYSRERETDRDRDRFKDQEIDREKGGYYKQQSDRDVSRDKGWKGKSDWDRERGRERDNKGWDRGDRRASDSTRFSTNASGPTYYKKQGFYSDRGPNYTNRKTNTPPPTGPRALAQAATAPPMALKSQTQPGNLSANPTIVEASQQPGPGPGSESIGAGNGNGNGNESGSGALSGFGSGPGSGSVLDRLFSRDPSLGSAAPEPSTLSFKNLLSSLGIEPPKSLVDSNIDNNGNAQGQDQDRGAGQAAGSGTVPKVEPISPTDLPPPVPQPLPPPEHQPAESPGSAPPGRQLSSTPDSSLPASAAAFTPVSNSVSTSSLAPPDSAMSSASSMTMPPPATPSSFSTASSATLAGSFSTTTPNPKAYVIPTRPSFVAPLQTPENFKREEMTREERAHVWDKRIELLSEAIAAKRVLNERMAEVKQLETLSSAERTSNLAAAVREQVQATLKHKQALVEAAQERVKLAQQKVLDLDFWPVRKRPEEYDPIKKGLLQIEEEQRERKLIEDAQEEIKDSVNGLGDAITKLEKQMQEVALLVSTRARSGTSVVSASESAPTPGESMDWEPTDGPRGMKRRKTGDDGVYASDAGSATPVAAGSERDRELRLLTHRIAKLETSFHELENLYHQDETQREEELSQLVETHVDSLRGEVIRGLKTKQGEKVKRIEEDMEQMDREVRELGNEIAELYERLSGVLALQNRLEEERTRVRIEREKLRSSIEENNGRTIAMQQQIAANMEETQSLRQQLLSLSSSISSSNTLQQSNASPGTHMPSLESLTQALLPRLLDAVRVDVERKLQEQKADVIRLVKEHAVGTASSNAVSSGNQQQHNRMKEALERAINSPDVITALRRSGALNMTASGNAMNGSRAERNGSKTTPTPPP